MGLGVLASQAGSHDLEPEPGEACSLPEAIHKCQELMLSGQTDIHAGDHG